MTVLTLAAMMALTPKPPKYFEGEPIRECVTWHQQTTCCLWRGDAGLVACVENGRWVVVSRSS